MQKTLELDRLWTIIRYELLMSWRRGSLRSILIMMAILPLLSLVVPLEQAETIAPVIALYPEAATKIRAAVVIATNVFVVVAPLLILPMMVAEVIPLDRQYRMRELLDTMPFKASTYLAGKMLGIWGAVTGMIAIIATVTGLLTLIQTGPLRLDILALFWVFGILLLSLFSTQTAIMLAASYDSRKQAILTGMIASTLAFVAYFILPTNDYYWNALLFTVLTQIAPPDAVAEVVAFPDLAAGGYMLRIGLVLALMAGLWAWTVRRVRKDRNDI